MHSLEPCTGLILVYRHVLIGSFNAVLALPDPWTPFDSLTTRCAAHSTRSSLDPRLPFDSLTSPYAAHSARTYIAIACVADGGCG